MNTPLEDGATWHSGKCYPPAGDAPTCLRCEGLSRRTERLEAQRSRLKGFLDAVSSIVGEFDMFLAEEKITIVRYHRLRELMDKFGDIVADYDIWWFNEVESAWRFDEVGSVEKAQEVNDGREQSERQRGHK